MLTVGYGCESEREREETRNGKLSKQSIGCSERSVDERDDDRRRTQRAIIRDISLPSVSLR